MACCTKLTQRAQRASPFLFLFVLPLLEEQVCEATNSTDAATAPAAESVDARCMHGTFNADTQKCTCYDGWATAGPTDTIDFLEGVCEQYHCVSDEKCREVLKIDTATCPVKNWNCYCGWDYAWENAGHGYETPNRAGGGECMGVMYTFSVSATELTLQVMAKAWIAFLVPALLLLPFGRKRVRCDHHNPSMWNSIRALARRPSECRGQCVAPEAYSLDLFKDDVAWSLYSIEIGIWVYAFLTTVLVVVLFIWSVILWALVVISIVVAAAAALLTVCGECLGGGSGGHDCSCCDCNNCCDCCFPAGFQGGHHGFSAGDCCGMPTGGGSPEMQAMIPGGDAAASAPMADATYFLFGGPQPSPMDPWMGWYGCNCDPGTSSSSCSCCNCCTRRCCFCCRPLEWLCFVFPKMPENAWGGLCGFYVTGTHNMTPEEDAYRGGNRLIDLMGMVSGPDLHGNTQWHDQVTAFLVNRLGAAIDSAASAVLPEPTPGEQEIRGVKIIVEEMKQFTADDRCPQTSLTDYEANECWICAAGYELWDMRVTCRHLFCARCSSEMLRRLMPCPLCRVASSTVIRRPKYSGLRQGGQGMPTANPGTGAQHDRNNHNQAP